MTIRSLGHLVLTVTSIEETCAFCTDVLGMTVETFADGRFALRFGDQKINLHAARARFRAEGTASHPREQRSLYPD